MRIEKSCFWLTRFFYSFIVQKYLMTLFFFFLEKGIFLDVSAQHLFQDIKPCEFLCGSLDFLKFSNVLVIFSSLIVFIIIILVLICSWFFYKLRNDGFYWQSCTLHVALYKEERNCWKNLTIINSAINSVGYTEDMWSDEIILQIQLLGHIK